MRPNSKIIIKISRIKVVNVQKDPFKTKLDNKVVRCRVIKNSGNFLTEVGRSRVRKSGIGRVINCPDLQFENYFATECITDSDLHIEMFAFDNL